MGHYVEDNRERRKQKIKGDLQSFILPAQSGIPEATRPFPDSGVSRHDQIGIPWLRYDTGDKERKVA